MVAKQLENLPFDVLRKGFELAVSNAFSLVMAAIQLVDQFSHVTLGIGQLGQEELGKSFTILAAISLPDDDPDWRSFWSDWKDHRVKASRAFFYELFNPMRLELQRHVPAGEVGQPVRMGQRRAPHVARDAPPRIEDVDQRRHRT